MIGLISIEEIEKVIKKMAYTQNYHIWMISRGILSNTHESKCYVYCSRAWAFQIIFMKYFIVSKRDKDRTKRETGRNIIHWHHRNISFP